MGGITGTNDKRQVTAIYFMEELLLLLVVYKGKTHWSHPKYQFPGDWASIVQPTIGAMRT